MAVSVTPTAAGSFANPRAGGACAVDPSPGVVAEGSESNNACNTDSVVIAKANTTTALTTTPNPSVVGAQVTLSFTVTGPGGTPTGTVDVKDGATTICASVALAAGAGQCNFTFTSAGAKSLTATYNGDGNFNASTSSPATSHQVNAASTTTTISSDNPDPSGLNQSVTVAFTVAPVAPGTGTPTGSVTVTAPGGHTCSGTLTAGSGSCAITTLSATGDYALTATYTTDGNYAGSASSPATTHRVEAPALTVSKSNNVGGNVTLPNGWTWALAVSNASGGFSGPATFASGDAILVDTLPVDPSYTVQTLTSVSGVTGTIACSTDANSVLTCTASGGAVSIAAGGTFSVPVAVTTSTTGTYVNPTGGPCRVDPNNSANESNTLVQRDCNTNSVTVTVPPPVANADSYSAYGNVQITVSNTANGVLGNDTTGGFGSNSVTFFGPSTGAETAAGGSGTSASSGILSVSANGTFTYNPAAGFRGPTDTFKYTVSNGGASAVGTATITILDANTGAGATGTNVVWFVDNSGANGDGRATAPFSSIANYNSGAADTAGDLIYVKAGSGTYPSSAVTLLASQQLLGAPVNLTSVLPARGSPNGEADSLPAVGTKPTLSNAGTIVTLPGSSGASTVDSVDLSPSGGVAIGGAGAGAASVNNVTVTTSSTAGGVSLTTQAGTFTYQNGSIGGTGSGAAVAIGSGAASSGGSATINFTSIPITQTGAGRIVEIQNRTGGAVTLSGNLTCNTSCTGLNLANNSSGSPTFTFSGTTKTLNTGANAAITLATNTGATTTFSGGGLDVDTTSGTGLSTTSAGTVNVTGSGNTINSTGGPAISANGVTFGATFDSVTSGGGAGNLSLTGLAGTLTMNGGALSGSTAGNAAYLASGGAGSVTYAGTIAKTNDGNVVTVTAKTGGSVSLSGAITNNSCGVACDGISLTSNTGATINFSGGMALSTSTNPAFTATGGGTVNATQNNSTIVNTLATTTGTALNVANTTIGGSGLTFRSISANGAPNGMVLNSTGSSGGLTVTGNGGSCTVATPTCTGGSILNSTGATGTGVSLSGAGNVSLTLLSLTGNGSNGIRGSGITGLTVSNSLIVNNGNADPSEGHGINVQIGQNENTAVSASQIAFTANRGSHFNMQGSFNGSGSLTFSSNTLSGGNGLSLGQGVGLSAATPVASGGYIGSITYDINGNTVNGAIVNAINVNLGTSGAAGTFSGKIRNNTIGTSGQADSCSTQGNGIGWDAHGHGTHTSSITGNTIRQCLDRGVLFTINDGDGTANVTMTDNTIAELVDPNFGGSREGVHANMGASSVNVFGATDSHSICLVLGGSGALANSLTHGPGAPDDFRLRQRFNTTVRLPGYAGAPTDTTAVVSFVSANNNSAVGSASVSGTGGGFVGGAVCPTPP